MKLFSLLLRSFKFIANSGVRDFHDSESRRKIYLINIFLFTAILCLISLGTIALYQHANSLALADLIIATALSCLLFYLHNSGNQVFCSYTGATLINIFYCFLFLTGGVSGTAFMWLYTYPIISLFSLGLYHGTIATSLLFIFTLIVLAIDLLTPAINLYDLSFALRFIPSFLIISCLTYIIEKSRADAHEALINKQAALTQAIVRLKRKETQLKTAQDRLEQRVAERTHELVDANKHLQEEIEDRKKAETERNNLQSALSRAQKMEVLGRLAAGVAHDLNNVLAGIVSYPDFLLIDLPQDSPLRIPLETIKKSGERAAAIVQDLLTLARRGVTVKKPVSLNAILNDYFTSPEYNKLCSFHPYITVEAQLNGDIPLLNGSTVQLQKSVMNLIGNAFEAVEPPGFVKVSTERKQINSPLHGYETIDAGDYVVLRIEDSGTGMSPEVINSIFEPFYTKKQMGRSGTGLGMTVVWGAVKDHKGFFDIKSIQGKGTVIYAYFPIVTDLPTTNLETPPKIISEKSTKGESILIVDDEEEQRDIGLSILTKLGYRTKAVSSGEKAVQYLKQHAVDLILLDMIMISGMDGLDTYRAIQAISPKQKVIIVSGYSENERVQTALNLGNGSYLKKPYTIDEVSSIVKTELLTQ
jgi:signal transduction histidine kinase